MTGEGGVSGSESVDYGGELISTVTTRNDAFEIVEIAYTATIRPVGDSDGGEL